MATAKSKNLQFHYTTYIATSPAKLWAALTNGRLSRKYFFGRQLESDWKVGGPIIYWADRSTVDIQGEVMEYTPPHKLVFTFTTATDPLARQRVKPTRVSFVIKPMGKTSKLTLTHSNLLPDDFEANADTFRGLNNGWPAILANLKTLLETGKTLDLPAKDHTKEDASAKPKKRMTQK